MVAQQPWMTVQIYLNKFRLHKIISRICSKARVALVPACYCANFHFFDNAGLLINKVDFVDIPYKDGHRSRKSYVPSFTEHNISNTLQSLSRLALLYCAWSKQFIVEETSIFWPWSASISNYHQLHRLPTQIFRNSYSDKGPEPGGAASASSGVEEKIGWTEPTEKA
ncbi:hypothetical protein CEXT_462601 [Caerostris extrusa]|uniref:Uncharacterized protein n=1 Tax=Caerostris extrusa TaxID=172846 RepID=A0AAV4YFY2_CAEEX|nr:hypothetical protein CEXT_462601 [Caerostris extrusa]